MALSKKQQRDVARAIHLILALPIVFLVYGPADGAESMRLILQGILFPVLVATGMWMWLSPKLAARTRRTAPPSKGG